MAKKIELTKRQRELIEGTERRVVYEPGHKAGRKAQNDMLKKLDKFRKGDH